VVRSPPRVGGSHGTEPEAHGPTGIISVYERDGEMAVVAASASPADPSACGADEVISACSERLDPGQIEVQGSITVAEALAAQ
ncbi:MAG: hypothetical protein O2888_04785, partial [Chloroflexi bacterium]|nr:hypothetical protein [Chloroflexota bacterium]